MGYGKRKNALESTLEEIFWLNEYFWQIGAGASFGCFVGFLYTLSEAIQNVLLADSNPATRMLPALYPIACFILPGSLLLFVLVFAWASHRSWIKQSQGASRWF